MKSFSALENPNALSSKRQIVFLLYLGIIGVISHYAFPSESIVTVKHSKPVKLHESERSPNYMVEGESIIFEDKPADDADSARTFQLIILFASLTISNISGINHGKSKRAINSFPYDSTLGYSPLRSPPPIN